VEGIDLRSRPGKEHQMQMLGDGSRCVSVRVPKSIELHPILVFACLSG
jgi:hypothetical protein